MTKATALKIFREMVREVYDREQRKDVPMLREAWNNYTDSLCKDGRITPRQYDTWTNPF